MRFVPLIFALAFTSAHAAPAPQPEESDVARLPPWSPHWVLVQTLPSGMTLLDGDKAKILAGLPTDFNGNTAISPDLKKIYIAETLWTKHTRGIRQDLLTTYDATTLDIVHEMPLPPRAQAVFKAQDLALSANGKTGFVFNMTPATSVTVVDMAASKVTAKLDTPGCGLIFPWLNDGFSLLCGNGTLLNVALPAGQEPAISHSAPFFDARRDPVFESSLVDVPTGKALFISFTGRIIPATLGAAPVIGPAWSLQEAAGQKPAGTGVQELAWRPGGYQVAAWHKATHRLFVLMHPGTFWTQKDPGTEIWVFDLASHTLLRRIPLKLPAKGIAISQDAAPLLFATTGEGDVAIIQPDTGEELRSAKFHGGGPLLIAAGQ